MPVTRPMRSPIGAVLSPTPRRNPPSIAAGRASPPSRASSSSVSRLVGSFEGMLGGFKERADKVQQLLRDDRTMFTVIATPDEAALFESAFLAGRLAGDRLRLGGLVVNRVHTVATVPAVPDAVRQRLRGGGPDERVLAGLLDSHASLAALVTAEQRRITALLGAAPATGAARVQVPLLDTDLNDLPGLRTLGTHLLG